jgi:Protein of unknown function (DUF3500)
MHAPNDGTSQLVSMSRRDVVVAATAAVAGIAGLRPESAFATHWATSPDERARRAAMEVTAERFLSRLRPGLRRRASFPFGSTERTRWHWTINETFPRRGVPLTEMTTGERRATLELLEASVSGPGFRKAREIMSLQRFLGRDPTLYFASVFGRPGSPRWGWRFEGHHLSLHFTIAGGGITSTPFFLGAWPTRTPRGLQPMAREEEAARELVRGLDATTRAAVVFRQESLTDHLTQNAVRVRPLPPVGLRLRDLGSGERRLAREIVDTYLGVLPAHEGQQLRTRIERGGFDRLRFGWSGALQPGRPHYYRLQGPTFLLEFDNSRNEGTHIHSVWRDYVRDFARHRIS